MSCVIVIIWIQQLSLGLSLRWSNSYSYNVFGSFVVVVFFLLYMLFKFNIYIFKSINVCRRFALGTLEEHRNRPTWKFLQTKSNFITKKVQYPVWRSDRRGSYHLLTATGSSYSAVNMWRPTWILDWNEVKLVCMNWSIP